MLALVSIAVGALLAIAIVSASDFERDSISAPIKASTRTSKNAGPSRKPYHRAEDRYLL
jgi:hypothetical protein